MKRNTFTSTSRTLANPTDLHAAWEIIARAAVILFLFFACAGKFSAPTSPAENYALSQTVPTTQQIASTI